MTRHVQHSGSGQEIRSRDVKDILCVMTTEIVDGCRTVGFSSHATIKSWSQKNRSLH
jgi:hypothetical protein